MARGRSSGSEDDSLKAYQVRLDNGIGMTYIAAGEASEVDIEQRFRRKVVYMRQLGVTGQTT